MSQVDEMSIFGWVRYCERHDGFGRDFHRGRILTSAMQRGLRSALKI